MDAMLEMRRQMTREHGVQALGLAIERYHGAACRIELPGGIESHPDLAAARYDLGVALLESDAGGALAQIRSELS